MFALLSGCIMANESRKVRDCESYGECYNASWSSAEQDLCLLDFSGVCSRPELCMKIVDRELEYRCRMHSGEFDQRVCAGIDNVSVRDDCFFDGADLLKDAVLCEGVSEGFERVYCLTNVALKSGNRSICTTLRFEDRKEFCFAVSENDVGICSNIVNEELQYKCVEWTMESSKKAREYSTP
ncbi:MAG: hypothetical protein V1744_04015 [Candidatus Altiarchaeota archaeon]